MFGEATSKKQAQPISDNVQDANLEENPKLKLVADVLQEIRENEDNKVLGPPVTLIVCAEDRACSQLKQVMMLVIRFILSLNDECLISISIFCSVVA